MLCFGNLWNFSLCQARPADLQTVLAEVTRRLQGRFVRFSDETMAAYGSITLCCSCAGGVLGNRLAVAFEMGVRISAKHS